MTTRLLTVSWTLEGRETRKHLVRIEGDGTLCGHDIPADGPQYVENQPVIYGYDVPDTETCVWCLRKLKRGAEAMAEKEGE